MASTWKVSNVKFDPHGDVVLVISSEATERIARFQVNSHCLCLASSVFRAMLGANARFKEADALRNRDATSPPVDIILGEDEPKALALLLRIVHLQSQWVPKALNPDQLFEVAIVCDKYDMRQILGLWLDHWIPPDTKAGDENLQVKGDKWLFIAYAFGREELFKQLSKELIITSCVGADGSLLTPTNESVDMEGGFIDYLPSSVVAEIAMRRQQAMENILDCLYQKIKAYTVQTETLCAHSLNTDLCDSFYLGFLQRSFAGLNLYPLHMTQIRKEPSIYLDPTLMSLQQFKTIWDSLKSPEFISFQRGHRGNHASACSPIPELNRRVGSILNDIKGLDWSHFVPNTKISGSGAMITNAVPKSENLWDYLEYESL